MLKKFRISIIGLAQANPTTIFVPENSYNYWMCDRREQGEQHKRPTLFMDELLTHTPRLCSCRKLKILALIRKSKWQQEQIRVCVCVTATPFLSSSLFLIYEVLQDQSYQLKPHNFPHGSNRELVLLFWNKNEKKKNYSILPCDHLCELKNLKVWVCLKNQNQKNFQKIA